jgi:hypothetical protein
MPPTSVSASVSSIIAITVVRPACSRSTAAASPMPCRAARERVLMPRRPSGG